MKLSEHFSYEEMTTTQVKNVGNTPPAEILPLLKRTAESMDAVRALLGHPIHVNSGYRSPRVNSIVGGAPNSAHMAGYACDFVCPGYGLPLEICMKIADAGSGICFDQVIEEGTWTHISFDPRMRRQVLTKVGGGFVAGLPNKEKRA